MVAITRLACLLGMVCPLLASPVPNQQGNLTLLADPVIKPRCKGCGVSLPGMTSRCDDSNNQIQGEDFEWAIRKFGDLNDQSNGPLLHFKSVLTVRHQDVVIWSCNCGGPQDFPADQLGYIAEKMKRECPGDKPNGFSTRAGWVYMPDWRKGLNVDTNFNYQIRVEQKGQESLCGKWCLN
ncbi:hypothetical protein PG993_003004 [Apiospora rasikravindrae]|uniref:Uncharacterized protein n=1 Tax=Apiospora rasikravindrae TaxID=990691 RepID=A0ABR1U0Z8_9PEZI